MAVDETPWITRIWATSGNNHNSGISQDFLLVDDAASFYLWVDLPYLAQPIFSGYNRDVTVCFMLTGASGNSGYDNDYDVAVDQNPSVAMGESLVTEAIKARHEAKVWPGTVLWPNSGVEYEYTELNIFATDSASDFSSIDESNHLQAGIYCLGKISFSNVSSSVDEVLFTLAAPNFIQGGNAEYTSVFSDYDGVVLSQGSISTSIRPEIELGGTIARLYRSSEPVPEPSTYALIAGIGLVGTAWASRRRRRNAGTK